MPATPISSLFAALSGAVREVETAINRGRTGTPMTATALDTGELPRPAAAASAGPSAADAATPTETEREQSQAELNMSVGWIPGVGTVFNAMSLVSDFLDFTIAALSGDTTDMGDEIRDMTVDVIGMIPIVGGPLAAMLHYALVPDPFPGDHAPTPVADNFSAEEDVPLTGNVLSNDTDVDGDPLTAALGAQTSHGAVTLNADGSFTYIPTANYNGADGFTYTVSDGMKAKTGTVTIDVSTVNDAPVAGDDTATLNEDTPTVIAVLGNDTDVDADPLTVTDTTTPGHGTANLTGDGTITYTPAADYNGPDLFTYTVSDGHGGTAVAAVSLTIKPVNDAPVAVDDPYATDEDTPLSANVLSNDTDVDADPLSADVTAQPTHGDLTFNTDGSFTYTPAADYNGPDGFTYTVSDGVTQNTGTVTIDVNPVNDPPVAGADSATLNEDTSTVIAALTNDSDIENDPLSIVGTTAPGHGTATIGDDATITYKPTANYNGTDSFSYTVTDGNGGNTTAIVSLTINPVNDPPVAVADSYSVNQDTQLPGNVKNNDSDPDGDTLTVTLASGPAHGNLNLKADGSFTYNPAGGYSGTDSFTYTITDTNGASATGTANITVKKTVRNELTAGQWLEVGQYLQSPNSRYRLYMQGDGNLVLYDEVQSHKALWASGTNGQQGLHAAMQGDGNLVLYAGSTAKWSTKTNGWTGARLVLQDDGNLVIYKDSTAVWDRHAGVLKNPPSGGSGGSGSSGRTRGATRSTNPFTGGLVGYCTYGAQEQIHSHSGYYVSALTGAAYRWKKQAEDGGWTVVLDAQPRSVVVFQPGISGADPNDGHVGWVESVQQRSDGLYVTVVEMNGWSGYGGGFNKWDTHVYKDVPGMSYILIPY